MKKKAFTLIELIAVLVILAILALIVIPLVMNIIKKAKISADRRSVDAYGHSVELAIATHLLDTGTFPTNEQLPNLKIEYSGNKVECNVMNMKKNGGLYLSQCKVNNIEVKDSNEEDGYYHYGTRDLTNSETIEMYGKAIEEALKEYHNINNSYPTDISELTLDYTGENIFCDVEIYGDGAIYMTKCSISGIEVKDDTEDGYYHYGTKREKLIPLLLSKTNDISITNYTDGNTHEMYTFEHPATEQTSALTDYRYIGATPNNYVTFNNELWRIIGVFKVEDENGNTEERIKIIRNNSLLSGVMYAPYSNGGYWVGASINSYLNDTYYNSIDEKYRFMIADTKFYLGTRENLGHTEIAFTGIDYYNAERSNITYDNRDSSWIGKIGLMYPSDYIYVNALGFDDIYFNNTRLVRNSQNWIRLIDPNNGRKWTITPFLNHQFVLVAGNRIENDYADHQANVTVPVLYLSSSVKITSGDGSEQSPYQLSL